MLKAPVNTSYCYALIFVFLFPSRLDFVLIEKLLAFVFAFFLNRNNLIAHLCVFPANSRLGLSVSIFVV